MFFAFGMLHFALSNFKCENTFPFQDEILVVFITFSICSFDQQTYSFSYNLIITLQQVWLFVFSVKIEPSSQIISIL
jgi:hypothetical protein